MSRMKILESIHPVVRSYYYYYYYYCYMLQTAESAHYYGYYSAIICYYYYYCYSMLQSRSRCCRCGPIASMHFIVIVIGNSVEDLRPETKRSSINT